MRQIPALLLFVALTFPLIAPAVSTGSDARLPACCRRDGKHGCGMLELRDGQTSELAIRSGRKVCPSFPSCPANPPLCRFALLRQTGANAECVFSQPMGHVQTESRCRASFTRWAQKRGPPLVLS